MSDVETKKKSIRRQRSILAVHYNIKRREEMTARPLGTPASPPGVTAYRQQVAGHRGVENSKYLGLLQCSNGTILKPILKESQRREVQFYERLRAGAEPEPSLAALRRLVPRYAGTTTYRYGGEAREYLALEDLAQRMLEPCIMDVKIGRRTWDPLATEEKIKKEQSKYALCKQQYAFCIPGYQVYRLGARRVHYNKEHGKKLHGEAVIDAIRNYLHGGCGRLCRALVLQLLAELWRVQTWSRRQGAVRLYSSSLLLIYDAARLRACCGDDLTPASPPPPPPPPASRPRSKSLTAASPSAASFSGQLSAKGPIFKKVSPVPLSSMSSAQAAFAPLPPSPAPGPGPAPRRPLPHLSHNHSLDHNYEDELCKIRMNYRATLDLLSYDSPQPNPWGTVKIIDFAHAFFNEDHERQVDDNFREGIESLVKIFEGFLRETDVHPF